MKVGENSLRDRPLITIGHDDLSAQASWLEDILSKMLLWALLEQTKTAVKQLITLLLYFDVNN